MKWQVYREDFNNREIKIYDIFTHGSFVEAVKKMCKKKPTKEEFEDQLRRILQYNFWSRAEHEVIVTSWPAHIDKKELDRINTEYEEYNSKWGHYPYKMYVNPDIGVKIDIYDQVMLNWPQFSDYVWQHRNEL